MSQESFADEEGEEGTLLAVVGTTADGTAALPLPPAKRAKSTEGSEEPNKMFPRAILVRPVLPPLTPKQRLIKLMCWNVNGLKSVVEKCNKDFVETVKKENPDVLFLQETKIQADMAAKYSGILPGYTQSRFSCSTVKKGYSGTAAYIKSDLKILSTRYGLGDFLKDDEGRCITLEFQDFFFVGIYVANSGQGLVRLKYRIETYDLAVRNYVLNLSKVKPVVLGGDLNVAHKDEDVYNFDAPHLKKQAGCTKEERESFTSFLATHDRVDSFRALYPTSKVFSYWSTRAGNRPFNRGLRLDYFVVPKEMMNPTAPVRLFDSWIVDDAPEKVSDHAPICCHIIVPVHGQ